ncbi:MAG: cytochrome c [Sulfurovum sp.]|nr:cytochrome c [Sulfurovum sp.]
MKTGWITGIGLIVAVTCSLGADSSTESLQQNCLSCHQRQQIPSDLIYRRYLMKYSTSERIEKAMLSYLKHPQKKSSIMPPQFFLKFPMKQPMQMSDEEMKRNIKAYIKRFDVKKRLILQKQPE